MGEGARARAAWLVRRPARVAAAVGGLIMAVGVTAATASGAYFTATSTDAGSSVRAGAVELLVVPGAEILDGTELGPGVVRTGTVEITNVQSAATLALSVVDYQADPVDAGLEDVLEVEVWRTSGSAIAYQGPLGELHGVDLGTFGPGEQVTYQIAISWPADDPRPPPFGAMATFAFEWTATST